MRKLKPLEYAFYLLKLRDRSIGEMEEKFRRREYDPKEAAETMAFLIEKGFLNDEKFAENFVRFKKSLKPVGKFYLRNKLMEKKISTEIIEKVLSENADEVEEIAEATDRWLKRHQNIPKEKIYQKLVRHLLSRGFDWEKVKEAIMGKL